MDGVTAGLICIVFGVLIVVWDQIKYARKGEKLPVSQYFSRRNRK